MTEGRWGIGQKVILFISLSVLVFLVGIFLITRNVLGDYALATADELASTILDQTDKRLGQFFEEMEHLARGLAGTRAVLEADEAAMGDLFVATVLPRARYLRAVYLGTEDGRMFEWGIGQGLRGLPAELSAGLRPPGPALVPGGPRTRGISPSPTPTSTPAWTTSASPAPCPSPGPDGTMVGVLGLDILLEDLARILEDLEIPKQGKALLVSSTGVVVASQFPGDRAADPSQKGFATCRSRPDALREVLRGLHHRDRRRGRRTSYTRRPPGRTGPWRWACPWGPSSRPCGPSSTSSAWWRSSSC
ncbi:MAG: cache domain-containing protein [Candidatus Moduliflexus flocculans]|nr:cache domain-containing protein [Candidatus Moduliflexus flocculans]